MFLKFERDIGLHKLVFREDVLADGTEVAYYARGKVTLIVTCSYLHIFITLNFPEYVFVVWAATIGWLQNGIWNSLWLL